LVSDIPRLKRGKLVTFFTVYVTGWLFHCSAAPDRSHIGDVLRPRIVVQRLRNYYSALLFW